jgi:glycerophosphoryl diester phosphodiesterase
MTQIVAHRGASSEAPENTPAAFRRAIELGADMIEFDVRRGWDGGLVISHDPVRKSSPPLPTLEETLILTAGRIRLDVELKEPACEQEALRLLLQYLSPNEFCVTSFLAPVLHEVRVINAGIRTGLIFATWDESVQRASGSAEVDLLVPHYRLLNQAEKIGKPLFVWTVDDPALTIRLFSRPPIEGIVTNNPRQALALRASHDTIRP